MPKLQEKPSALYSIFWGPEIEEEEETHINADPCGSGSQTLVLGLCSDGFYKFSLQTNLYAFFDENYLLI